jgi:hypothetical protein
LESARDDTPREAVRPLTGDQHDGGGMDAGLLEGEISECYESMDVDGNFVIDYDEFVRSHPTFKPRVLHPTAPRNVVAVHDCVRWYEWSWKTLTW